MKKLLAIVMLSALPILAQDNPTLQIVYDPPDIDLKIIIPPTTNEWFLQFSTNLYNWDSVDPRLDSFPNQTTTNQFIIFNVQAQPDTQVFFRASNNTNATMAPMMAAPSTAPCPPGFPVTDKRILKIILPPGWRPNQ